MSSTIRKFARFLSSAAVVTVASLAANGCGSSNGSHEGPETSETEDSGTEAAVTHPPPQSDAASEAEAGTTVSSLYDGTVGLPCRSDADCQPAGGPGVNTCSTSLNDPIYPTPICISPSCALGPPGSIEFCDGPSDSLSSPGVCFDTGSGNGVGVCLPQCGFLADGSAPRGCQGKDACYFFGSGPGTSGGPVGIGYCFGGCTMDTDCPIRSRCQVDTGLCLTTVTTPSKAVGQACTQADNGNASASPPVAPTCNCLYDAMTSQGLCTQFCVVGATDAPCPDGFVCDSFENTPGDAGTGFATQNVGLAGSCLPVAANCGGAATGDAGAVAASCPTGTTCTSGDSAGLDCQP